MGSGTYELSVTLQLSENKLMLSTENPQICKGACKPVGIQ